MQDVFTYIRKHKMIRKGDRIVVGVSGGADSVCLLFMLLEYQKEVEFEIKVVHIEHGIRGKDSLEDAQYVEKLCREQQVPFECFHADIPSLAKEQKLTLEEAGRRLRYQTFENVLAMWHGTKIAVAHNKNDQAETMLFQMARGSGLKGSAGIWPVRDTIIRPLLSTDRARIEAWLKEQKIAWREDITNQEEAYTRNSLRRQILPLLQERVNPGVTDHLFSLSEELQETESYLEQKTAETADACMKLQNEKVIITIDELGKVDPFLRSRVIRYAMKEAGCGLKDITREHVLMILNLAEGESGRSCNLPGGWIAVREFSELVITRNLEQEKLQEVPLVIDGATRYGNGRFITRLFPFENQQILQKTYTKWLDYDKIKGILWVRTRRSGDYLVINRQGGTKKLKSYLTEEKIPVSQKDQIPLICLDQEVLWVIGHRIGETGKISPQTKMILEIIYEEDS